MILLYLFAFVVLVNCAYLFLFSSFVFGDSEKVKDAPAYSVSVLVCAKNEAENLKRHIPLWLHQEYADFELVLINDASSDDTLEVMEKFASQDNRIKIVDVQNNKAFWANKKYALTLGIKSAKNKRLLFTDADCRPATKHWISEMAQRFSKEKQLILGYGAYEKRGGLLNLFIRYETLITALQYFSYAKLGIPYMGVGRNLGYTSNLYYEHNGFASHMKLPSGDDDLFVNQTATKENTALCYDPRSFTYSIPKQSWKAWFYQKRRHISTANHYKPQHKYLLGGYYLSKLLFWILLVECLFFTDWKAALAIAMIHVIVQYIVVGAGARKLEEGKLIPFLPILDLFLVFLQLSIFISGSTSKQSPWK